VEPAPLIVVDPPLVEALLLDAAVLAAVELLGLVVEVELELEPHAATPSSPSTVNAMAPMRGVVNMFSFIRCSPASLGGTGSHAVIKL
jgi:hypothetical protein